MSEDALPDASAARPRALRLPGGKSFAFTIFDDTDRATVQNVAPVYALLTELGLRVTKSVWPLEGRGESDGQSLADPRYADFVRHLRADGHEIGLHNVRNEDSRREVVREGLDRFQEVVGSAPAVHCNHEANLDNLYWGVERLRGPLVRLGYNASTRFRRTGVSLGHVPDSPYFWGDLCLEQVQYVRNLVFDEINLMRVNPSLPYHDPERPFVRHWFSSSEGGNVERFLRMLRPAAQDRLEEEGGVCIMYTHFAARFCEHGALRPEFVALMKRLASKRGWFVPVSTLLDHLLGARESAPLPSRERAAMERRWLVSKLLRGVG